MRQLLSDRDFALLWLAQIISGIGDVLYNVGVMVTIFEQTGSALQTAGVLVASSLPGFVLGPVAGAIVDKMPRRHVLLAADLFRALLVGSLLLLTRGGDFSIVGIYLVVAGLGAAATFYKPARQALLPALVDRDQLVRANGLIASTNQATLAAGYAMGGLLVVWLGFHTLVIIDLFTFVAAALLVALIKSPADRPRDDAPGAARRSLLRAVQDGGVYLRDHRLARTLVVMEVAEHIPHAVWTSALMLVFVSEALDGTPTEWGYQNAAFYAGMLAGAALSVVIAAPLGRRPGWFIIANALLFALLTTAYALSPSVLFAIILCFAFGPTASLRDVAQDSLLQATVRHDLLGRVYALRSAAANLVFMLAGLLMAYMADQVNVRWVYATAGVLYLATGLYAFSRPTLRRSRITAAEATARKPLARP